MSSRDDYPYPEDEFDSLGADRTPLGVHRAPLPRWRQLLPFLIVLVLAPTLAFVAVRAVSAGGGEPGGQETTTTQAPTTEDVTTEDVTTDEPTGAEPSSEDPTTEQSTEPTADLDMSVQIWVLNGSGVSGLAADAVEVLTSAGWQDATADDYGSSLPSATTIFYDNADQAEEAQAVGGELGIDTLVENSDAADGDIVVVLRSDFSLP